MAKTYITGAVVRAAGAFTQNGAPIDPTTVQAKVKTPTGTTTYNYPADVQLVKDGPGLYHVDVDTVTDGTHRVRFSSTGAGKAAGEALFNTKSSFV
jgi:hypothetical protein